MVDETGPAIPMHPTNAISAGMSGTLLAHAALALITGAPNLPENSIYGMNLVAPDHNFVIMAEAPRPDCTHCGAVAGLDRATARAVAPASRARLDRPSM